MLVQAGLALREIVDRVNRVLPAAAEERIKSSESLLALALRPSLALHDPESMFRTRNQSRLGWGERWRQWREMQAWILKSSNVEGVRLKWAKPTADGL